MKVIVFAHRLELGGTQVNAIELAAELRDRHDFDIVVHAAEGPALALVRDKGLRFVPAPDVRHHPSLSRMRALRELVHTEKPDLIHAWDWWQGLEAYYGTHLTKRVPLLISDMMMKLTRSLPHDVPTTFGFDGMTAEANRKGWQRTMTLLPPVDTVANAPQAVDGTDFRRKLGAKASDVVVVSVSRLATVMKADSLIRAIAVVRELGNSLPLKLVIVGDGEARGALQALADDANRHLYREAVVLTGEMSDPRPAYAAADIVLGMGGSALRGLAFAKPLVVVGDKGFATAFTPTSAPGFAETGMYGIGDGSPEHRNMLDALRPLAQRPQLRAQLSPFGREYVMRYHDLGRVGTQLAEFCRVAIDVPATVSSDLVDAARTAFYYLRERRFKVASRDPIIPRDLHSRASGTSS